MAGKKYMSKKEYSDFVKEIQELNNKYSSKIKIDSKSGVLISKGGLKLPQMHLYKKDRTQRTPKAFNKITSDSNNIVGTFEKYLRVDQKTYDRINALNSRLRDLQVPDRSYNFTSFRPGVTQQGEPNIIVTRNNSPLNRTQFLYERLQNSSSTINGNTYIQVQNNGLEYDLETQRPQTLNQLIRLASPARGIQQLQNIISIENQNYLDKIKKVDPNMLTSDVIKSKEAQLGEALDKYEKAPSSKILNKVYKSAREDRDEYIRFLYYAFGVTVSSNDRRKSKLTMTDLRNNHNETITKYAANNNLRKLITTIGKLTGPQYLAAISQQSGIGRWELMDTVKQLLGKTRVYKDVNVNDADQQYDLEVVDGQDVDSEKYKVLDNLFISMNSYFNRYRNYKA